MASTSTLERALTAFSDSTDQDLSSQIEEAVGRAMNEITHRSFAAAAAYPMSIEHDAIILHDNWDEYLPYIFCLVLSYFSRFHPDITRPVIADTSRWFEHLSRDAAQSYMSGVAVRFGFPRDPAEIPAGFQDAVDYVCRNIIFEGVGYKPASVPDDKDAGIDVLACRNWPDQLPGKILLFGQCASGIWWNQKVDELNPEVFIKEWLQESPRSQFVKSMFIPHRIDQHIFEHTLRHAGIVFDRCRVALWAHGFSSSPIEGTKGSRSFFPADECQSWIAKTLGINGESAS